MKKLVSVVMILAMILCLGQAAMGTAFAGQHDYIVRFHSQGGHIGSSTGPADVTKTLGQDPRAIAAECARTMAYKDGYRFIGWYTAASGGTYISTSYTGTPVDVYAHWVTYTAAYTVGIDGGSYTLNLEGTSGHRWTYSGSCNWVQVTKKNDKQFKIKVLIRGDVSLLPRVATLNFTDNYGNVITVYVTQAALTSDKARKRADNAFDESIRFFNVCTGTETVAYNNAYAALFKDSNTWCTDSAMMDLLNRKLAVQGVLSESCFFDIRDVITGMASGTGKSKVIDFSGFKVEKCSEKHSYVTKGKFKNGGEFCNYWGENGKVVVHTSTYTNQYGGASANTFTVKYEGYEAKNDVNEIKTKIINLLVAHPEGIFVYSHDNRDHALVIVGYENGKFVYVDNGAGLKNTGRIGYDQTYFKTGHKVSEDEMFKKIRCIAYVQ